MDRLPVLALTDVEAACRDLGWRLACERPMVNNVDRQYVARILAGAGAEATLVGLGMSPVSAAAAIEAAWWSARETLGEQLVHRPGGTVLWDGETFTVRDRWYWLTPQII